MPRWALRILAASLLLLGVGYLDSGKAWCEVLRVSGVAGMAVSFALLIVNYVRTSDPNAPARN